MLGVLFLFLFLSLIVEYLRFRYKYLNEKIFQVFSAYLKDTEKRKISSTTVFFSIMILIILLFPKGIALISLAFLIFPDAISALVGSYLGKIRLTKSKTLEGSIAFFITCLLIGVVFKRAGFNFSWLAIFSSSLFASMVELIPYIDDNLSVPLVAGITFKLLS
ncbi:MAG: hypothetical protein DRP68_06710 [Candidatus Omnitrophota bacterium]|nr:MAG: hypothetical protein DRP68_06710 [Candidatus Omnitrophota bacterium]RKY36340.1 MAG: hypothetical protein DRP72_04235 [Candidatus Omnitrophota bacterium]